MTAHGTAMLCVASDAPSSERIGLVSAHAYTSGALAAELLAHKLARKAHVAIITGELTTLNHADKLRGFAAKRSQQGLYISTANSVPVLQALEEERLLGKIQVVTTDLFQELVPLIETGKILATLFQRALSLKERLRLKASSPILSKRRRPLL